MSPLFFLLKIQAKFTHCVFSLFGLLLLVGLSPNHLISTCSIHWSAPLLSVYISALGPFGRRNPSLVMGIRCSLLFSSFFLARANVVRQARENGVPALSFP